MKYKLYIIKRRVEDLFIFPFILLGRLIAFLNPLREEYDIFFFFPFYTIGGAEKVHLQIAHAIDNRKAIIFFSRKSGNDLLLKDFIRSGHTIRDISAYTDNKWFYFNNLIFRGIITGYIKAQNRQPIVFNGQCNFGYKISPWLPVSITQIELIHSFCSFSYIRIPFIPFYEKTIMISRKSIEDHLALYRRLGVPAHYEKRIHYIPNGIETPKHLPIKNFNKSRLTVLYVGRGTPEKRVHLVAAVAAKCYELQLPIDFQFLGDVEEAVPAEIYTYCRFYGNQNDPALIADIYNNADFITITSSTEGFPMAIMEAMARGLIVIATAVGDIPRHVKQGVNGFVIDEVKNEAVVVEKMIQYLKEIIDQPEVLREMSVHNVEYAKQHFDINNFNMSYQRLLNSRP